MSILIQPFKCDDVQVKFGLSCEKQKEIQDSFNNLSKSNTLSSAFSVGSDIGGDPLGLNFEEDSKKLSEKLSKEAQEKAVKNISELQRDKNKKDYLIYGIGIVLVLGVIIFEFKNKK
jgi:hypothetical protein